jgi:hypothetical protein
VSSPYHLPGRYEAMMMRAMMAMAVAVVVVVVVVALREGV